MKKQKKFKCNLGDSIIAKIIRNFMLLVVFLMISDIADFTIKIPFNISLLTALIIYFISFVLYIYLTNNDLSITNKSLLIRPSIFSNTKNRVFKKDEIRKIVFKDEWSESFMRNQHNSMIVSITRLLTLYFFIHSIIPWDYKWMQIITKNGQTFTYYFFGLNYDFYDNSEEILFEDMFLELAANNIRVEWKSTEDNYFRAIQKKADKIYLELNK